MTPTRLSVVLIAVILAASCADDPSPPPATFSVPHVISTSVIGPFTGAEATLHPDNLSPDRIAYYGTDLGFTYTHDGEIRFLFGDTWATESYSVAEASSGARFDDMFGAIPLNAWPDPIAISPDNIPPIRIGQNPGGGEVAAIDVGHAMDLGKTPMGGFSNGAEEFGVFNLTKPVACRVDADCGEMSCAREVGMFGIPASTEEGLTLPCVEGSTFCAPATLPAIDGAADQGSGFCADTGSSVADGTAGGKVASVALRVLVGRRDQQTPKLYRETREWLTNKFANVAARAAPDGERVYLWGRPGFVGVGSKGRSLGLYFSYVDMPVGADYVWEPNYYAGMGADGEAVFSKSQNDAVALDLDAGTVGNQPEEVHDIVHQMTVAWIEPLQKWVMFYGGGVIDTPIQALPNCGVLELFARSDCRSVNIGNGAIRMRTADAPWGPWSPPEDVIEGGDPAIAGSGQYGPGGVLHHPACDDDTCAAHTETPNYAPDEYGFFYAANIIEEWTTADESGVTLLWNASTWDPYRVVLLRTRIRRSEPVSRE